MGRRRPLRALAWVLLGLLVGGTAGFAVGLLRGPERRDVAGAEPDAPQRGAA